MNSTKKKIVLAVGIFWLGIAIAIAIPSYATHAGARHPNPSMIAIMFPLLMAGLMGAFKLANSKLFIAFQFVCAGILLAVVFAMDQRLIGPDWPAYTCTLSAFVLGVISVVATSLMKVGEPKADTPADS